MWWKGFFCPSSGHWCVTDEVHWHDQSPCYQHRGLCGVPVRCVLERRLKVHNLWQQAAGHERHRVGVRSDACSVTPSSTPRARDVARCLASEQRESGFSAQVSAGFVATDARKVVQLVVVSRVLDLPALLGKMKAEP